MGVKIWYFGIKSREPHINGKNKKDTKIVHNPVALFILFAIGVSLPHPFLPLSRHIFVVQVFLPPRSIGGGGGGYNTPPGSLNSCRMSYLLLLILTPYPKVRKLQRRLFRRDCVTNCWYVIWGEKFKWLLRSKSVMESCRIFFYWCIILSC